MYIHYAFSYTGSGRGFNKGISQWVKTIGIWYDDYF